MTIDTDDSCPFCKIATNPSNAHVVYSDEYVVAFLDIMPLTKGHTLVIPRKHRPRMTDMSEMEMRDLGAKMPIIAKGILNVLDITDFNIIQNNGESAGQTVHHVHLHIIPRSSTLVWNQFGKGFREDLDDEEAAKLTGQIKGEIGKLLEGRQSKL